MDTAARKGASPSSISRVEMEPLQVVNYKCMLQLTVDMCSARCSR